MSGSVAGSLARARGRAADKAAQSNQRFIWDRFRRDMAMMMACVPEGRVNWL